MFDLEQTIQALQLAGHTRNDPSFLSASSCCTCCWSGCSATEGINFWYLRSMDTLLSRITIDPAICHGKPCVRGLRYPVETLLEMLSSGMTIDDILADYEDLERDDLLAVLAYAALLARTRRLQPVVP